MGFFLVGQVKQLNSIGKSRGSLYLNYLLIIILCASFVRRPIKKLGESLLEKPGREVFLLSKELSERGIKGRFASNTHWGTTLYIAYHSGSQYFGIVSDSHECDVMRRDLPRYGVNYYFVWGSAPNSRCRPNSAPVFRRESIHKLPELENYEVRDR